jgi:hypothetical protein
MGGCEMVYSNICMSVLYVDVPLEVGEWSATALKLTQLTPRYGDSGKCRRHLECTSTNQTRLDKITMNIGKTLLR